MNQEEINSCKELYNDIDACITALIKARTEHNQEDEGKALFRMEGLMVAAQQQLAYFIDKPVPEDVLEAANQYIGYPPEVDEGVSTSLRRRAFADGMLAERERLMKDAVECNVIWYDGRLLDFTQEQLDAALDKIGAGVDAKVSVIIIKKEK